MTPLAPPDPSLTLALAMVAGILAQAVARHLRLPGIVLLLAVGVALGPEGVGLLHPRALGEGLGSLVGFAVAVILFEGGMNLSLRRLRRESRTIRRLVTVGALVSGLGGAAAAYALMRWDLRLSLLFGTLVIVTGPTVVTPLLRRLRLQSRIATVLEAEGVLIDPVGAILAVVALDLAIHFPAGGLAEAAAGLLGRLGLGALLGVAGGLLAAGLLRPRQLIPEGLENTATLSLALALFQGSNILFPESGIMAVTVAGLVVGNLRTRALADLREFKEQLTVLLIGVLFVLLAADVRMAEVRGLGVRGLLTVAALIVLVRPLNVAWSTRGTDLTGRERAFLAAMAPRGIVAAAVASLFAESLRHAGLPGGDDLRALVFLVIAITVPLYGLSGGIVARLLGLRRPSDTGFVILGANDLGRALGRVLRVGGQEVVLVDVQPDLCHQGEEEGFRVLYGNALQESVLLRAEMDGRSGAVGLTTNDGTNLLFGHSVRDDFKVQRVWVALRRGHASVTAARVHEAGCRVLFGEPRTVDLWTLRLERGIATVEPWTLQGPPENASPVGRDRAVGNLLLPLAVQRDRRVAPVDEETRLRRGDVLHLVIFLEKAEEARAWLAGHGWEPAPSEGG